MKASGYEILAIIPARGGSRGIPRKNVQLLAGKPLIAHSIERALQSKYITRLVVSTDDHEIGEISEKYSAEVIWRPAEISGDEASSESALLHVLDYLGESEGYQPQLVVFLQCTSPLTLPEDIDGTIQSLLDEDADSALAVIPFHYFLWKQNGSGDVSGINHDKSYRPLRQEREPQYLETGAVYVMRTSGFLEAKHRFFGKTVMYTMPQERHLEIDEPVDFKIAEVLLKEGQRKRASEVFPEQIGAVVLDFDGVFTDNKVLVFQDGREAVVCDRGDGWGISQLKKCGLPILVLSTEVNPVVQSRCEKLGIQCLNGVNDKLSTLKGWLEDRDLNLSQVIYVGNDVNDLDCLKEVGCGIAVSDAHPIAKAAAKMVLAKPGGKGALRELAETIENNLNDHFGKEGNHV